MVFGQITLFVPPGDQEVEIYFQETGFKLFLDVISLISLIVALLAIFKFKVYH